MTSDSPIWSPDGTRLLGYVFDPGLDHNSAIAIFDPSKPVAPITIPADTLNGVSWQRLARESIAVVRADLAAPSA